MSAMAESTEGKSGFDEEHDEEELQEETTPSGDLLKAEETEAGEADKSSKLDKLLQRLQGGGSAEHSRESSPDPANKDSSQGNRQSRRKPKVTRKVVEDGDDPSMDAASSAPETTDADMVDAAMDLAIQEFLNSADKDPAEDQEDEGGKSVDGEDSLAEDKQAAHKEAIDVDEDGNLILPEGTVVVQPEAVTDNKPVFKGPEFRNSSNTSRKSTIQGGEVDLSAVHCSACNHQINTNHANSVKRHPVLKVVLCKRCYNWYTSDEILQDQDGMDEQCRWCGEGGDLLCCDYCHNAFCKSCIRKNLGRGELSHLMKADEDSKWHCYVCDPKPLAELIYNCDLIIEAIEKREDRKKDKEKKTEEKKKKPAPAPTLRQQPPAAKPLFQGRQSGGKVQQQQKPGTVFNLLNQKTGKPQQGPGKIVQQQHSIKPTQGPQLGQNVFVEWNFQVNESNVVPIIDRAMMVTESMHMLLSSLREDIQKAGNVNTSQRIITKLDSANKLKRALSAFNKSYFDLSLFSQKTSGPTTVRKMMEDQQKIRQQAPVTKSPGQGQGQLLVSAKGRTVQSQNKAVHPVQLIAHGKQVGMGPGHKLTANKSTIAAKSQQPKPKPATGKVEYIELLDSDDESKSKVSSKGSPKTNEESDDDDKALDERIKNKPFKLKVALGGPGHKLKGPLSKRRKFEEQEQAKKAKEDQTKDGDNKVDDSVPDDEDNDTALVADKDQPMDTEQGSEEQLANKSSVPPSSDADISEDKTKAEDSLDLDISEDKTKAEGGSDPDISEDRSKGEQSPDKTEPVQTEDEPQQMMDCDDGKADDDEDEAATGHAEDQSVDDGQQEQAANTAEPKTHEQEHTDDEKPDPMELDEFKTIEEQLKQLNSGYTDDSFSKVDDLDRSTPNSSLQDKASIPQVDGAYDSDDDSLPQVVGAYDSDDDSLTQVDGAYDSDDDGLPQVDGGNDNRDSSSNSSSPVSARGESVTPGQTGNKSYNDMFTSLSFEPLFNLDTLTDSGSSKGSSDDEQSGVVYDFGEVDQTDLEGTEEQDCTGQNGPLDAHHQNPATVDETASDDKDTDDEMVDDQEMCPQPAEADDISDLSNGEEHTKSDDTSAQSTEPTSVRRSLRRKKSDEDEVGRSREAAAVSEVVRSREDIEAQRLLHKELLDDSDDNVPEQDDEEEDEELATASEEESEEESSKKKKNKKKTYSDDDEYNPKGDAHQLKSDRKTDGKTNKGRGKGTGKRDLRCIVKVARLKDESSNNVTSSDSEQSSDDTDKEEECSVSKQSSKGSPARLSDSKKHKRSPAKPSDAKKHKRSEPEAASSEENSSPKSKHSKKRTNKTEGSDTESSKQKQSSKKSSQKDSSDRDKSSSENFDSDLEKDIENLAKMPKLRIKKLKKPEVDEESVDRKKNVKDKDKAVPVSQHSKKKTAKDLVEELSSGDDNDDINEDEAESEKPVESDDNASELHQQAAFDQRKEDQDSRARNALLAIDSSDDSDDSDMVTDKKESKKNGTSKKNASEDEDYDSEDILPSKRRLRSSLLDAKISDSDDDLNKKKKRKRSQNSSDASESNVVDLSTESTASESDSKPKKKGKKKKKVTSDSGSDSEASKKKKGKGKKRRKRVKMDTDSSNEGGSDAGSDDDENAGKKRKKIRKILNDQKLSSTTQTAGKAEEQRRERVKERQKKYNQVTTNDENSPTKCPVTTKLVLEMDEKTEKAVIEVNPKLIRLLKPHQVEAVKFMWDCCAETVKQLQKEDGGGCILAHCMGLGKTLSVISFLSTIMASPKRTKIRTALIVCPLNTVLNWQAEFAKWLDDEDAFDVWEMSSIKDNYGRCEALQDWHDSGGIMIIGYEMYRNLTTHRNIKKKKMKATLTETLVDPGPDIIVCDEGHILKNSASSLSKAVSLIHTRRRIVLTGTPLQNNLVEYHCMVDFVKPNLLGSKKEFTNRFVNPITNGQCSDATSRDVKVMKRRAHILHETLAGCVQRRDYSALTKFLMPKYEYVVSVRLAPKQMELYEKYLERNLQSMMVDGRIHNKGARLFKDYQQLMKIWTHPWSLKLDEIRQEHKRMLEDNSDSSFIDDEESESDAKSTSSSDHVLVDSDEEEPDRKNGRSTRQTNGVRRNGRGDPDFQKNWKTRSRRRDAASDTSMAGSEDDQPEVVSRDWWGDYLTEEDKYKMEVGGKIMVLAEILKMSDSIGDKVLVFSQSLLSLNLIEDFLEHWDQDAKKDPSQQIAGTGSWVPGLDYYRMDGSTSAQKRQITTSSFNDPENTRMRLFLISTKAGSLGINLVSANRVIVFDASWNPTHDVQSIFRVYRFGQEKPVYVYRFLAQGTMEEKIYERQVIKQSLSQRVVDEHQIERHFSSTDLQELYSFRPDRLDDPERKDKVLQLPKDRLLAELLTNLKDWISNYHEHDSLLENIEEETLTEEERKAAWEEYEQEKKGLTRRIQYGNPMAAMYQQQQASGGTLGGIVPEAEQIARAIYAANPGISQELLQQKVHGYLQQRMEQQQMLMMQRQHEQRMQEEIMKLQQMRLQRYRQQQYLSQMQGGSGSGGGGGESGPGEFSALMQQLAGSSSAPATASNPVTSRSGSPDNLEEGEVNVEGSGLLNLLRRGINS